MIEYINEQMKDQMLKESNTSPCFNRGYIRGFAFGYKTALAQMLREIYQLESKQSILELIEDRMSQSQSL